MQLRGSGTKTGPIVQMRFLFALILNWSQPFDAQTNDPRNNATAEPISSSAKPLDGEQKEFFGQLDAVKKARTAFNMEMAREKEGDCPRAVSTLAITTCLSKEIETTTANYNAYIAALRPTETLKTSTTPYISSGPRKPLSPAEELKEFDQVEAAWQTYRKLQCKAAYDVNREGTIAPVISLNCELELLRNRMRELENIYQIMH